jgi:hypothetical protein
MKDELRDILEKLVKDHQISIAIARIDVLYEKKRYGYPPCLKCAELAEAKKDNFRLAEMYRVEKELENNLAHDKLNLTAKLTKAEEALRKIADDRIAQFDEDPTGHLDYVIDIARKALEDK